MSYIKSRFRFIYDQFISLKGTPHHIACGMAIGIFVGITPTIPFHTALAAFFSVVLRKNFTAACMGTWIVSNPITIPVLYFSEYRLGKILLPGNDVSGNPFAVTASMASVIQSSSDFIEPLLTGGILLAPLFAVPGYFITRKLVQAIRMRISHDDTHQDS